MCTYSLPKFVVLDIRRHLARTIDRIFELDDESRRTAHDKGRRLLVSALELDAQGCLRDARKLFIVKLARL
jgi:hypothetical protein